MKNFDFSKEIYLENDRVRLSPLQLSDVEVLENFAIEEPELWTYSLKAITSVADLAAYIQKAIEAKELGATYPFVIYDKQYSAFAGSTRFYHYDALALNITIGYTWIGRKFQKTGLNSNIKFLMLQFVFETMGVERVEFRADAKNSNSIAAMKRIGCTIEGVLRSDGIGASGLRRDSVVLSILKNEWENGVKEYFLQKLL